MKVYSRRESEQRLWKFIIERPYTILVGLGVFLILAGGFSLSLRFAETEQLLYRYLYITVLISLPAFVILAIIWRRERQKPYAWRVRRNGWKIMFGLYLMMLFGVLLAVLFVDAQTSRKVSVLALLPGAAITGIPLYRILKKNEAEANQSPQRTAATPPSLS